jgi:ABC-type branched-subunit amino acid transport system ATPase component
MTVEARVARIESELNKLLTTHDVMDRFGVTHVTVGRWVRKGKLHGVPGPMGIGYVFAVEDVDNFVVPQRGNPNFGNVGKISRPEPAEIEPK